MRLRRAGGPGGGVDVALREVDVDEQREQRTDHRRPADLGHRIVRPCGGPFEQVAGQRGLRAGEVEASERADGVGVRFEPRQELGRLLEPALADPEVGRGG